MNVDWAALRAAATAVAAARTRPTPDSPWAPPDWMATG